MVALANKYNIYYLFFKTGTFLSTEEHAMVRLTKRPALSTYILVRDGGDYKLCLYETKQE